MNKVVLIGRMVKDPELKFAPGSGTAVTNFTLAVNRRFKKEGQPEADFLPIVVWGKQAESTANYMSKGKLLSVAGRIETRSYDAKDGTKRYVTEVIADEVHFLEWGDKNNTAAPQKTQSNGIPDDYFGGDNMTPVTDLSDIPF